MRRIDDDVREAIAWRARELDGDGQTVNRRALAREFDVSPQTVVRILGGASARRGGASSSSVSSADDDSIPVLGTVPWGQSWRWG